MTATAQRRSRGWPAVLLAAFWLTETLVRGTNASAQTVTTPPFTVATDALNVDVTATFAGTYFVYGNQGATLYLQRIGPTGVRDGRVIVEKPSRAVMPAIAPLRAGGFTTAWRDNNVIYARFLDVLGIPSSSTFQRSDTLVSGIVRVASVTSGTVIVWAEATANGKRLNAQVGFERRVLDGYPLEWDVAATSNGGCIVVWRYLLGDGEYGVRTQRFDGSGVAIGDPDELAHGDLTLGGIAVDPVDGGLAIVGLLPTTADHFEVRAARFGSDGSALGPEIVVDATMATPGEVSVTTTVLPQAAFDYGGDLYVVWGDHAAATTGVRARAFDPTGTPLGPTIAVATDVVKAPVRTALTAEGRFVNAWMTTGSTVKANVVSLCAPASALCGDGVRVGACERCDDGTSNDDVAPDACRSNCVPAHCGDGVVDSGEQCDDGNFTPCDGCSPNCESEAPVVCGDGVTVPACGEECDDGNAALLDGCTPACRLERIPGGGSPKTDCLAEWAIDNSTTVPPYDKKGAINAKQTCVDGDAHCDFDGGTSGSCTFHVRVCGNDTNLADCPAPDRLASWVVERPTALQGTKKPWLAAVRANLADAVPGAIVGPSDADLCSPEVAITVPLRGVPTRFKVNRLKLQSRADDYADRGDKDKLSLECRPAE